MPWTNPAGMTPKTFVCGFCGQTVGANTGFFGSSPSGGNRFIYICPYCENPTYFDEQGREVPGVAPGSPVDHLPAEIESLYNEARSATAVSAYTAAVLCCRKLLAHIAVDQGAEENQTFIAYVEYLANSGFVPPHGKGWVDHIRTKGNEANHEIVLMSKDDAADLISFAEMLLKFIYEFPKKVPPPPL